MTQRDRSFGKRGDGQMRMQLLGEMEGGAARGGRAGGREGSEGSEGARERGSEGARAKARGEMEPRQ
jgi:hypothetical protein